MGARLEHPGNYVEMASVTRLAHMHLLDTQKCFL